MIEYVFIIIDQKRIIVFKWLNRWPNDSTPCLDPSLMCITNVRSEQGQCLLNASDSKSFIMDKRRFGVYANQTTTH